MRFNLIILIKGMCIAGVVALLVACGGKYSDAEKVLTELADATEVYLQDLNKANDAEAVAAAIDSFAEKMEGLAPRMKEMNKKYPELQDPNNVPEKLKPIKERSDKMATQMGGALMKAMPYMKDAKVSAAFTRLGKVMSAAGN